jgi:hypothetical protein
MLPLQRSAPSMAFRHRIPICVALVLAGGSGAAAQTLHPIPAAECQQLAAKAQAAIGIAMRAGEDDFSDVVSRAEGRACHITGSASNLNVASAADLMARLAGVFADWREDPARAEGGADGVEKGYTRGASIATVEVSWEPGPGVTCSDKQPLSACQISPQQKLWNVVIDAASR